MNQIMNSIQIVIADDHQLFRNGLKILLGAFDEFTIVGEAVNGEELLKIISNTPCDLVLMDIDMPPSNGVEALGTLRKKFKELPVIMLTVFEDNENIIS